MLNKEDINLNEIKKAGGSNTNKNGLSYEELTNLDYI